MRRIERTSQFKRDYKREIRGPHRATLKGDLAEILTALATDQPLADKHRDHALIGDWKNHRDCHIKPDLVLIYRKPNARVLQLVRLGSHSELSL
jgi:mRNA interferase YafQ